MKVKPTNCLRCEHEWFPRKSPVKQCPNCKSVNFDMMSGTKPYRDIHQWLKREYGKPEVCESEECEKRSKTYDWSLIDGKRYEKKRVNFQRLCRICHLKYDRHISTSVWASKRKAKALKGKVRTVEQREHLRKVSLGKKMSDEMRRKMVIIRTGVKCSEETKRRMSISAIKRQDRVRAEKALEERKYL
ncbi:MAG TPA: hypothetical protein ENI23_14015 [bacterium]|nr:hypothetical protein [bacterium]